MWLVLRASLEPLALVSVQVLQEVQLVLAQSQVQESVLPALVQPLVPVLLAQVLAKAEELEPLVQECQLLAAQKHSLGYDQERGQIALLVPVGC